MELRTRSWSNKTSNFILERIHSILRNILQKFNIQESYLDKDNPWMGILAAVEFTINSTKQGFKGNTIGQLIFYVARLSQ